MAAARAVAPLSSLGAALLSVLIICAWSEVDEWGEGTEKDSAIPDKVGAEVHLSKTERTTMKKLECSMCKAIMREMHIEVSKHGMIKKGWGSESQVWETSSAICLAMLQKYKLSLKNQKLEKKAEDEDEEMSMAGLAPSDQQDFMRGMLVLKMGCQHWLEDYGGDVSGWIFKAVKEGSKTADASAQEFCIKSVNLCGGNKDEKKRRQIEKDKQREKKRRELRAAEDKIEEKRKEDNPFEKLPEDSKLGLQRMLEMAKDDPFHYMEDDAKARVLKAKIDLRCDVCRVVIEDLYDEVVKKPKSMQQEYDVLPMVEGACEGGKDLSVPNYFGVEPPPLPPLWTDRFRPHLTKKTGRYQLRRMPKKQAKQRKKWRSLTPDGRQKPPPPTENEGDMMMTLSCKDVVEPEKIAEGLVSQMAACRAAGAATSPCEPVLATARRVCRDDVGSVCEYLAKGGNVTDTSSNEGAVKQGEL
jgi:hypothetical protein